MDKVYCVMLKYPDMRFGVLLSVYSSMELAQQHPEFGVYHTIEERHLNVCANPTKELAYNKGKWRESTKTA